MVEKLLNRVLTRRVRVRILAIELLNASQALHFRQPLKTSDFLEDFLKSYRAEVPFIEKDEILHVTIKKSIAFIENLSIDETVLFGK